MKWHDGLGDRWDDVQPIPPLADVRTVDDGEDVVGKTASNGFVIRDVDDSSVFVLTRDLDDVVDLDEAV